MKETLVQTHLNHVALLLDASGSMNGVSKKVVEVADRYIDDLKRLSLERNQETRISIYVFSRTLECVVFDQDVCRPVDISKHYYPRTSTRLYGSLIDVINDLKVLPELYGDHAFLLNVLTDGEDTDARGNEVGVLRSLVKDLPENWTLTAQTPGRYVSSRLEQVGFHPGNVSVWETTNRGLEEASVSTQSAVSTYFAARAAGTRSVRNFYEPVDVKVTTQKVSKNATALPSSHFTIIKNTDSAAIQISKLAEFVLHKPYVVGTGYYQLVKKETVQKGKKMILQNTKTGKVYSGDNVRSLLGITNEIVKLQPGDFGDWHIYIQSNSVNRNIIPNQSILVLK